MRENFKAALKLVLAHEGGFSNHPHDPGGATMRGITQRVYDAYRKRHGKKTRSVREISDAEISAIYRHQYWERIAGDALPSGVDYCVFDAAVNSGAGRAARWLQAIVGEDVDGIIGERTLAAVRRMDVAQLIDAFCDRRLAFVRSLRTWKWFGKGWARRIADVRARALAMAHGAPVAAVRVSGPGKADGRDARLSAILRGNKGEAALGAGAAGETLRSVADTIFPFTEVSAVLKWVFIALVVAGAGITIWKLIARYRAGEAI
ncbi:MAG: hypothetical protein D6773_11885 [Alphaproteobacteria bacterium]|nr:MAG: hypothetical protein D6773_11885 [Alphaproteobacteria bacterium]